MKNSNSVFEKLNIDLITVLIAASLSIIGALSVFSTTYTLDSKFSELFINQIIFLIIGFVLMLLISIFNYSAFTKKWFVVGVFTINIFLLLFVLQFGEYINGAKRWIDVGFFNIQPSEISKVSLILITASLLQSTKYSEFTKIFNIFERDNLSLFTKLKSRLKSPLTIKLILNIVILLLFCVLIFAQNSLGNALLLVGLWLITIFSLIKINFSFILNALLFCLGILFGLLVMEEKLGLEIFLLGVCVVGLIILSKYFLDKAILPILFLIVGLIAVLSLNFTYNSILQPYQRNRITVFLNPSDSSELASDWNRQQSITAIGSGQLLGKGFLQGTQVNFDLLPFPHTDFIFASFAEQFGFVGVTILLIIYLTLMMRILFIAQNSPDMQGKLICVGVCALIFLNMFQNIGMNLGILPITGVPLPFMSYGGSAVLTVFIALGLVQSVHANSIKSKVSVEKIGI